MSSNQHRRRKTNLCNSQGALQVSIQFHKIAAPTTMRKIRLASSAVRQGKRPARDGKSSLKKRLNLPLMLLFVLHRLPSLAARHNIILPAGDYSDQHALDSCSDAAPDSR